TGALDEIWQAVRRLNQHVEASAPWTLAKDEANADQLDQVLYDLVDGLSAVAVAVAAYLPETAPRILEALGQPADLSLERVRPQRRSFRGSTLRPPLRDRYARAPRGVRRSAARDRRACPGSGSEAHSRRRLHDRIGPGRTRRRRPGGRRVRDPRHPSARGRARR